MTSSMTASDTFWWSRGVGPVLDDEPGLDEQLVDYCIPSQGCDRLPPTCEELCEEMRGNFSGCETCTCPEPA